jgi:hypothetical protein
MEKGLKSRLFEVSVSVMVMAAVVAPVVMFAKSGDKIYVDKDASGTENGSSSHPYKTISRGLKNAEKGDEVVVASGTYKERITIPRGVKLSGSGAKKTFIKSDDKDDATVEMKDNTKMWGVTIENGKIGVYVQENAKAEMIDVRIRDNRRDGVFIEKGERTDKERVSIVKSEISNNGWSGVYSKKRKIVITESDIKNNDRNGVMFESGVRAWIDDNSISENAGSGLIANLDGTDITVASKNTFRKNDLEGIEVRSYGSAGSIVVKKSRLSENGHYGVARISKVANVSASTWNGLVIQVDNTLFGNGAGNTSPIVRGF